MSYWILRSKTIGKIANAHGPFLTYTLAESAAKTFPPGTYTINEDGKDVAIVTVPVPQAVVQTLKGQSSSEAGPGS